jgi:transposase-like protein
MDTASGRHRGIERERLDRLVVAGLTVNEIARALDCGPAKVRHWLGVPSI